MDEDTVNSENSCVFPLVSVGIPTYNRPNGLRRTLECITMQTYKNLEIIVSDNCSPEPETEVMVRECMANDPRIQYYRQEKNNGPINNFKFVLEKATGEYFMWAADDDEWEDIFIEGCLNEMGNKYVAVTMEAQYFSEDDKFEFFEEGKPFYEFYSENEKERFIYILKYNYGNLYYSLFKRAALYTNDCSVFDSIDVGSLNEMFLFLYIMQKGNWKVLPQIGFYKRTNLKTYEQAKWEKKGGVLPNSSGIRYYLNLPGIFKYHIMALMDVEKTIDYLDVNHKTDLKKLALKLMLDHFLFFLKRYKPPLF